MSKKLTIAFPLTTYLPDLGGAEVGVHNIACNLVELGHRPVIIIPYKNYKKLKDGWDLPYEIIPMPLKLFTRIHQAPKIILNLTRLYFNILQRKYSFDFWHGTMGYPIGVALIHFANKKKHIPHLVRCTGDDIQINRDIGYGMRQDKKIDDLIRKWLPVSDNLIAITESVGDEYKKIGIEDSKIRYIPNGVDLERFNTHKVDKNKIKSKYCIEPDKFTFLCVGRNHPKKNFITLLKATKRLYDSGMKDFVLIFAGLGTEKLKPIAEEMGVIHSLRILGNVTISEGSGKSNIALPSEELLDIYNISDAFVFPSLLETFGIVLVEAMASRLPIITSNVPGCRDVVRNGVDGLVIDALSDKSLADSMLSIMNDENKRVELSNKAFKRAHDYTWNEITKKYISIYKNKAL